MRRERAPASLLALVVAIAAPAAVSAGPYTESGYDPALMASWATTVVDAQRGPLDVADPGLGDASYGAPEWALGPATGDVFDVYALGDGGQLTLGFDDGIGDGPGDDFAVYENGFFSSSGFYGEFAFVEVSSNGIDFARFDATSLQPTPVSGTNGDTVDPTDYHNLLGKHPVGVGTGFDLAELTGHPLVTAGLLDLSSISQVRLVDVIGDGSTSDHRGEPLYDPYPTPYPAGGADVEAVGVLHVAPEPDLWAALAAALPLLGALARRERAEACPGEGRA
jgi:hypothetical protein